MPNTSKKKVIYVITKSVWAGAGKYVYDLATSLPPDKFEVFVAAGPPPPRLRRVNGQSNLKDRLEKAGIPYFEIKHFQKNVSFLKDVFAYFELLWLFIKIRPNIIHTNSSKAAGVAGTAALDYKFLTLNFKTKTVFTAHGWAFHEERPKWQIFLIKLFSKITCLYYKKIICVSEFDRNSAIKNKIAPAKKLITIHNGIKSDGYEFITKEEARKELGNRVSKLDADAVWIGTIGEFTKNKGQKYLIEAASKLKIKNLPAGKQGLKFKIVIIGFGEEKKELELKIKDLKLKDKVFLIDNMPDAAKYLKAFDIFILPSVKEGLPYTLIEAGFARLPVIATNTGGIPEIIEEGTKVGTGEATGLLVKPRDPSELKAAIKKLIEDPNLKNSLAFELWGKVLREFRFEQMLKKTTDLYDSMC